MPLSDEILEAYGRKKLDEYTHWVYVLMCHSHYRTFDELERKAEARLQRKPKWLRQAFESRRLYYVGQTENLEKRLGEHFRGYRTSDFTELFEPSNIEWIEPQHSRNQAEYRERQLSKHWRSNDDDSFVYSY